MQLRHTLLPIVLALGQLGGMVHAQQSASPQTAAPLLAAASTSQPPASPVVSAPSEKVFSASPPVMGPSFDEPLVIGQVAEGMDGEPPVFQGYGVAPPLWMQDGQSILQSPLPNLELRAQRPGLVAELGVSVLHPYISSQMSSGTGLDATFPGNPVALPIGAMNFTGAPRIELGYRWPQGLGEFRTAFQLVNASGSRTIPDALPGSTRSLSSTLRLNVVDFDYCFSEFNLGDIPVIPVGLQTPGWLGLRHPPNLYQQHPLVMRLRMGIRAASMFIDANATGTQIVNERMTNNFGGAGLHVALELTKAMPWRPLSMYTRFDFAGLLGSTNQTFQRTDALGASQATKVYVNQGVPCFGLEWGAQWVPCNHPNLRASLAYQYVQWWQFADTEDSTASLILNGVMLSGQWGF